METNARQLDKKVVRRRMKLFRFAVDTFISAMEQVTKRHVPYRATDSDVACWHKWMDYFGDESVGEEFVTDFVLYGVQSWFTEDSPDNYNYQVRFTWIFGKNAINRFEKYGSANTRRLVQKRMKDERNVKMRHVTSVLSTVVVSLRQEEENVKAMYFQTKRGFLWCIANTTLYYHKSSYCATCKFRLDCKRLLKQEYKKVYKLRGYDG